MLNPNQVKVFLANLEDFLLTRGMFYSQKTYPGLEEFANNLEETIIGQGLIPQEELDKFAEQPLTMKRKQLIGNEIDKLMAPSSDIIVNRYNLDYYIRVEPIFKKWQKGGFLACHHDVKTHLFECLNTLKEVHNYWQGFWKLFEELIFREADGARNELAEWNRLEDRTIRQRNGDFGNFNPNTPSERIAWLQDYEKKDLEKQRKNWEQRNGVSFYGDWNFEDLLGKDIDWSKEKPSNNPASVEDANHSSTPAQFQNSPSPTPLESANSSPSQPPTEPTNSPTETSPNAIPSETESPADKPSESPADKLATGDSLVQEKSRNNSPATAKFLLGGGIICLFLVGTVILIKRKRVK